MEYEILVFEHNSMYDTRNANASNVLDVFLQACREYVNPKYVGQDSVHLDSSKMFVSYADRSGNDKPMLVILIGTITDEILVAIRDGLKKLYAHFCEDCGNEMTLLRTGDVWCNKC